ncbi:hypothetical protein H8702_05850 [Massilimaliae timonensis]|uniref:ABC transporter substrate-binding protein n=1 Tax=Massiliimalia timonensis TaxID=1987501 RepID=A0A8J6TRE3_9FIRM|nr:DUF6062 family protein [Massiliimalia timonensis]MBC8610646.1 hypothetical protein [Massiliimalia timonensis]
MRDSIYTIPVNEVFEPRCGCPICTMRDILEERSVEYIMGAAMMEPDVRVETNRQGFCRFHYGMMLKQKNRLSLALMLESHLMEIQEKGMKPGEAQKGGLFSKKAVQAQGESCFICAKIDWAQQTMFDTIMRQYVAKEEFRTLYGEQQMLCFPHFKQLTAYAQEHMDKKWRNTFLKESTRLCRQALDTLKEDVSHYCKMFDYRNAGENADWGNSKDSIERAVYFLTSRETGEKKK